MADRSFEFWAKGTILGFIINDFPEKLPSRREALIQLEKLQRMARNFHKKFADPDLAGKRCAADRHRLTQQYKAVDKLIAEVFLEWFSEKGTDLRKVKKREIARLGQGLTNSFNQTIHRIAPRFSKELTKALNATQSKLPASPRRKRNAHRGLLLP
jgi:hypothetical protein